MAMVSLELCKPLLLVVLDHLLLGLREHRLIAAVLHSELPFALCVGMGVGVTA